MDLTPNAQELLAFITPHGRVFKWKVMPFGVASAPALFQELMNKILSILQRRPKVQELISHGAQMEAHIDDVCLGTNTQEDHLILLSEFFAVCQENHTRYKLKKCEFMQETMQYLGFDFRYGWWTPAASKAKPLMDAKVRHEDPKKGLHDFSQFHSGVQLLSPPYQKPHLHQRHSEGLDQEEYYLALGPTRATSVGRAQRQGGQR